jgi:hypothetical protein
MTKLNEIARHWHQLIQASVLNTALTPPVATFQLQQGDIFTIQHNATATFMYTMDDLLGTPMHYIGWRKMSSLAAIKQDHRFLFQAEGGMGDTFNLVSISWGEFLKMDKEPGIPSWPGDVGKLVEDKNEATRLTLTVLDPMATGGSYHVRLSTPKRRQLVHATVIINKTLTEFVGAQSTLTDAAGLFVLCKINQTDLTM